MFTDHPADGINDVTFPTPIRAYYPRHTFIKTQYGFIGKAFKAFNLKSF
jgi:hypothetical protein